MQNLSSRERLAILLSVVWILVEVLIIYSENCGFKVAPFIGYAILPLVILWGIYWVAQAIEREKASKVKRCPYCAEEIQLDAVKCRFCGEPLMADGG